MEFDQQLFGHADRHNFEEATAIIGYQITLSCVDGKVLRDFVDSSIPHVFDLHHDWYHSTKVPTEVMLEHVICVGVEDACQSSEVPDLRIVRNLFVDHLRLSGFNEISLVDSLQPLNLILSECLDELIDQASHKQLDCFL